MATSGRDLTISVKSEDSGFDLSAPAQELEDLGHAGLVMGDEVSEGTKKAYDAFYGLSRTPALEKAAQDARDLGEAAQKAGHDVSKLGDEAKGAGSDVDSMRDKFEASSIGLRRVEDASRDAVKGLGRVGDAGTKAGRDVDRGMDKARQGVDDFKEEAHQSGREAAASFGGGFTDVADFVQETAANAFGGFGKIGAAAGIAAAVGIGVLTQAIQDAQQRLSELRQLFFDIGKEGGTGGLADRINKIADEAGADRLADITDALRATGVETKAFFKALAGDPGAGRAVREQLDALIPAFNLPWDQTANEARHLENILGTYQTTAKDSAAALGTYKDVVTETGDASAKTGDQTAAAAAQIADTQGALEKITEAQDAWKESVDEVAASLTAVADGSTVVADAVEDSAKRQAKATKDTKDTWQDYAETATGSIDTVIAKQREEIAARAKYEANMKTVFKRLGQAGVDFALSQGENADKAMALLASAPLKKGKEVVANYQKLGGESAQATARGMVNSAGAVGAAASALHSTAKQRLEAKIGIPTFVQPPPSFGAGSAAAAEEAARRRLKPIIISAFVNGPTFRQVQ